MKTKTALIVSIVKIVLVRLDVWMSWLCRWVAGRSVGRMVGSWQGVRPYWHPKRFIVATLDGPTPWPYPL